MATLPLRPNESAPRRGRRRNWDKEAAIQAAIVEYIRTVIPDGLVWAIPNGGLRTRAEAGRLKWTGVLAGMTDLAGFAPLYPWDQSRNLLPPPRMPVKHYFLEVKPPGEYLDEPQHIIRDKLENLGQYHAVVRSIDDVRQAFANWQIPTREVV